MSFDVALEAQEQPQGPRTRVGLRCVAFMLLQAAITFWLATFMVGGPLSELHTNASEIGRHDAVSVGTCAPTTWFRRDSSDTKQHVGVGPDLGPISDVDFLPTEVVGEQTILDPVEFVVAFTTQRRHAAPVRGPPCARV
jgi:hypothetical protein